MKYLLFCVIAGTGLCADVLAQGVAFRQNENWEDLLAEARSRDQLIFVDVYTDWCGPCKRMDKEVFTDERLAGMMNKNFINVKLNAEKGIGISLAKRYNVFSYPTYLFVNGDGTLIYRANGYTPVHRMMNELSNALSEKEAPVTLLQMDSVYLTGRADTTFLYSYIRKRTKLRQDNSELLDEYCAMLNSAQQTSLKTLQLIAENGAFDVRSLQIGNALSLLIDHQEKFQLISDDEELDNYISLAQQNTLSKAISTRSEALLGEILKWNQRRKLTEYHDESDEMWRLSYYFQTRQYTKYIEVAKLYLDGKLMTIADSTLNRRDKTVFDEVSKELEQSLANKTETDRERMLASYRFTESIQFIRIVNGICKTLLSLQPEKDVLESGIRWMDRSVSIAERDTDYFKYVYPSSLNIYASYLYKVGQKDRAISLQSKALELISLPGIANGAEEIDQFGRTLSLMKEGKDI